jgi:predicted GNAT family N-acyltransferase
MPEAPLPELIVVKSEECLPLREEVLRPGQPQDAFRYETDDEPRALHLAAKEEEELLGIATLLPEGHPNDGREVWRLRGMAVRPDQRGKGLGKMLLTALQAVAKQRGGGMWCTARSGVEEFYAHFGFKREGGEFEVQGAGPHVLMTWNPPPKRREAAEPPAEPDRAG